MEERLLSSFDDYPIHQAIEPLRVPGTGDRNFYDRYYFSVQTETREFYLAGGLGSYPNRGVVDGFVAVLHAGVHRVVRASRELGSDRADTSVGPIRVEVLQGLRTLRLVCEPNEWGLALDLRWEASTPARQEPRHTVAHHGQIVMDMCRFTQTGRWAGTIEFDGHFIDDGRRAWWGCRDRSWGIRQIGEPRPARTDAGDVVPGNLFLWAPIQFYDHALLLTFGELQDGTRYFGEAVRIWPERTGLGAERLGNVDHDLEFVPGTRYLSGGRLIFDDPGRGRRTVELEAMWLPCHLTLGTGYGGEGGVDDGYETSDWRFGMRQGGLVVQSLSYDLGKLAYNARRAGYIDHSARFRLDGQVGYGIVGYKLAGPYPRYGFSSADGVA